MLKTFIISTFFYLQSFRILNRNLLAFHRCSFGLFPHRVFVVLFVGDRGEDFDRSRSLENVFAIGLRGCLEQRMTSAGENVALATKFEIGFVVFVVETIPEVSDDDVGALRMTRE